MTQNRKDKDTLEKEIRKYSRLLYGTFLAGLFFVVLSFAFDFSLWDSMTEMAEFGCAVFGVIVIVKTIMLHEKNSDE